MAVQKYIDIVLADHCLDGLLIDVHDLEALVDSLLKALAARLLGYARSAPDRIRGRLTPAIVYDPRSGYRAFKTTLEKLAPEGPSATL